MGHPINAYLDLYGPLKTGLSTSNDSAELSVDQPGPPALLSLQKKSS